ncbi:MAG: 6-phosphogluconolactonase [Candidatus Omnitrophota bacterium]
MTDSPAPEILRFEHRSDLFDSAAKKLLALTRPASPGRPFTLALAGGTTPRGFYERMAAVDLRGKFPWHAIHFFWGDERWVAHEDPRSNYRMAKESLLDPSHLDKKLVHPVPTRLESPQASARAYEKELSEFFKTPPATFPVFDLILLGLGEDGHTASLFPGDPALLEEKHAVTVSAAGTSEPRVTLTLPVLNLARNIFFLVCGANKRKVAAAVLEESAGPLALPAQRVRPVSGKIVWFISD